MNGGLAAQMAESWKQWEGTVVDKFRLQEYLGGSDHSAVFSTHLPNRTSEKVVIKFVPVTPENLELQRVSWDRAAHIQHPHLLQLYGTGRCRLGNAEFLYLVMQYAEENLGQILPQRALSPDEALEMLPSVIASLADLHRQGLVHGALKPSNILAADDQLKLANDHIWPTDAPLPRLPRSAYDAPELEQGKVSPAADLWSLGAVLQEALTQRPPGARSDAPGTLEPPFDVIVRRCLEIDPQQRGTLADISRALQAPPVVAPPSPRAGVPEVQVALQDRQPGIGSSAIARMWKPALALLVLLGVLYFGVRQLRQQRTDTATAPPTADSSAATNSPSSTDKASTSTSPASAPMAGTSKPGAVRDSVEPNVSASARGTITGTIRLRIRAKVDASGRVTTAHLESPGPSRYFASKALDAAQKWTFTPPQVDGRPVPSEWRVHFEFRRGGSHSSAEQITP